MNEVLNCLETRRSCRAYRPEQVPEEALQEILRAGLYAPRSRPWRTARSRSVT